MSSQQLERELNKAREMGRWLSDDELEQIEHEQRLTRHEQQQDAQRRRKLVFFTAICVVIPPLWPVAIGLSLHLLFPQSFRRLLWFAGGSLLLLALLGAAASVTVVSLLWMLIS
ncbi:hypothetical protein [Synechococcus sp. UW179A]|uniref:hypothetical protein n=1 Tax=Synechococcus sp. UW179A TaxID=2575510 RepID=UPI0010BE9DC3|nr:hypothetical protein [Synechococcus sp. UW179A]